LTHALLQLPRQQRILGLRSLLQQWLIQEIDEQNHEPEAARQFAGDLRLQRHLRIKRHFEQQVFALQQIDGRMIIASPLRWPAERLALQLAEFLAQRLTFEYGTQAFVMLGDMLPDRQEHLRHRPVDTAVINNSFVEK
jgi:hypothetical protein